MPGKPEKNGTAFGLGRSCGPGSAFGLPAPYVSLRLLACWWSETEAEAKVVEAAAGRAPEPIRGTGDVRRVDPGTTA